MARFQGRDRLIAEPIRKVPSGCKSHGWHGLNAKRQLVRALCGSSGREGEDNCGDACEHDQSQVPRSESAVVGDGRAPTSHTPLPVEVEDRTWSSIWDLEAGSSYHLGAVNDAFLSAPCSSAKLQVEDANQHAPALPAADSTFHRILTTCHRLWAIAHPIVYQSLDIHLPLFNLL